MKLSTQLGPWINYNPQYPSPRARRESLKRWILLTIMTPLIITHLLVFSKSTPIYKSWVSHQTRLTSLTTMERTSKAHLRRKGNWTISMIIQLMTSIHLILNSNLGLTKMNHIKIPLSSHFTSNNRLHLEIK
jgi:uncharacterized membrane protein YbaN (DUF454 family)